MGSYNSLNASPNVNLASTGLTDTEDSGDDQEVPTPTNHHQVRSYDTQSEDEVSQSDLDQPRSPRGSPVGGTGEDSEGGVTSDGGSGRTPTPVKSFLRDAGLSSPTISAAPTPSVEESAPPTPSEEDSPAPSPYMDEPANHHVSTA